jgi:hypothetical protein
MRRAAIIAGGVCALALGAVGLVAAQQPSPSSAAQQNATPIPPPDTAPPDESAPTPAEAAAGAATPSEAPRPAGPPAPKPEPVAAVTMGGQPVVEPTDQPPPPPEQPVRSAVAVIQALDKVTAQTMRFAVPVNRRVRYKNLIFTAKACETKGLQDPQPQSAAYLIVESQPRESFGHTPTKQVFKGWMYAVSPGLHPLEHPVYDAWLVACSTSS